MSQITIRDLPEEVEHAIRQRARARHTSLNRIVTELVEEVLGSLGASRNDVTLATSPAPGIKPMRIRLMR